MGLFSSDADDLPRYVESVIDALRCIENQKRLMLEDGEHWDEHDKIRKRCSDRYVKARNGMTRIRDNNYAVWEAYCKSLPDMSSFKTILVEEALMNYSGNVLEIYETIAKYAKNTSEKINMVEIIGIVKPDLLRRYTDQILSLLISLSKEGDYWAQREFATTCLVLSLVEGVSSNLKNDVIEFGIKVADKVSIRIESNLSSYRTSILNSKSPSDFFKDYFILQGLGILYGKRGNYIGAARLLRNAKEFGQFLIDACVSEDDSNFPKFISLILPQISSGIVEVGPCCNLSEKDFVEIQYMAGSSLENGNGIKQFYKEAIPYYELAANAGHADAQAALGIILYQGLGGLKNEVGGRTWILKAADQHNLRAVKFIIEHPEIRESGVKNITNYHAEGDIYHDVGVVATGDAIVNRPVIGNMGGSKFCIYCGAELPEEARFCFKCGKKL